MGSLIIHCMAERTKQTGKGGDSAGLAACWDVIFSWPGIQVEVPAGEDLQHLTLSQVCVNVWICILLPMVPVSQRNLMDVSSINVGCMEHKGVTPSCGAFTP